MSETTYVIYKLYNKHEEESCYIGYTTNYEKNILDCNKYYNDKSNKYYDNDIYKFIRDNNGIDNCIFELLEKVIYINKADLIARKKRWINELNLELKEDINIGICSCGKRIDIKYKQCYNCGYDKCKCGKSKSKQYKTCYNCK